jgi:hypothetical protein
MYTCNVFCKVRLYFLWAWGREYSTEISFWLQRFNINKAKLNIHRLQAVRLRRTTAAVSSPSNTLTHAKPCNQLQFIGLVHCPDFFQTQRFRHCFCFLSSGTDELYHWTLSWAILIQFTSSYSVYEVDFNIILPSMPGSPKWSFPFLIFDQNFVSVSNLPSACFQANQTKLLSKDCRSSSSNVWVEIWDHYEK